MYLVWWLYVATYLTLGQVIDDTSTTCATDDAISYKVCPTFDQVVFNSMFDNVIVRGGFKAQASTNNIGFYSHRLSNVHKNVIFEALTTHIEDNLVMFNFFVGNSPDFDSVKLPFPDLEGTIVDHEFLFPLRDPKSEDKASRNKPSFFTRKVHNLPQLTFIVYHEKKLTLEAYKFNIYCNSALCFGKKDNDVIINDDKFYVKPLLTDRFEIGDFEDTKSFQYSSYYSLKRPQPILIFKYYKSLFMILDNEQVQLNTLPSTDKIFMKVEKEHFIYFNENDRSIVLYDLRIKNSTDLVQNFKTCREMSIEAVNAVFFPLESELYNYFLVLSNDSLFLFNYKVRTRGTSIRSCEVLWKVDILHYVKIVAKLNEVKLDDLEETTYSIYYYNKEIIVQVNEILLRFDGSRHFWKREVLFLGGSYQKDLQTFKLYENYLFLKTHSQQYILENMNQLKTTDSGQTFMEMPNLKLIIVAIVGIGMFMTKMNGKQNTQGRRHAHRRIGRGSSNVLTH